MKSSTFHILPLYTLMPIHDVNVSVVNFGFQSSDKEHICPPQVKTEHVLQYIVGGEGFLELGGKEYPLRAGDLFYLPVELPRKNGKSLPLLLDRHRRRFGGKITRPRGVK